MSDLYVKNLKLAYGENTIVEDFSYDFSSGKAFALMGASGCGKTTILMALIGLLSPQYGDLAEFETARPVMLFQEDRLLPWYTALENVALVSDIETARKWLGAVGLGDKLEAVPRELSGGQRRRVAIARAMSFRGDVVILDEPFSGLDVETKRVIADALMARFDKIIFTTHDEEEASLFGAEIIKI